LLYADASTPPAARALVDAAASLATSHGPHHASGSLNTYVITIAPAFV
jgi:poly-gamma-glutamate capsule biosynthesis protein CapA/YwtB (metallophosphatase superfamily)